MDSGFLNVNKRNMNRGKRQQQIYRPGSGPLRKSNQGIEETESDTNLLLNSRDFKHTENSSTYKSEGSSPRDDADKIKTAPKRNQKPDQPIYVAKTVVQAREMQKDNSRGDRNFHHVNGNQNPNTSNNKSKRHGRRLPENAEDDWRPTTDNRNARQGSEPRNNANWGGRMRDTRSVEPQSLPNRNYNSEKVHQKPPSGRRHSTIGMETDKRIKLPNFDQLPPRLRKKYLEDNNLSSTYGRPQEDTWDGSSITFQGSTHHHGNSCVQKGYQQQQPQHHHPMSAPYATLPNSYQMQQQQQSLNQHMPSNIYYSLPRGRGRLRPEYEQSQAGRNANDSKGFLSPCSSRPPTPPTFGATPSRSNENLSQYGGGSGPQTPVRENFGGRRFGGQQRESRNNRMNGQGDGRYSRRGGSEEGRNKTPTKGRFRESLEAQLSPVSPPTPEEKEKKSSGASNAILDWSEEVELNDRLEQEAALSDALTRSSSMASLMEVSTKSLPANTTKKHAKKKSRRRSKKRSGSSGRDRDRTPEKAQFYQQRSAREDSRGPRNSQRAPDAFKPPQEPRGRNRSNRDPSYEHPRNRSRTSREPSFERNRKTSTSERENWREEIIRSRQNSEREGSKEPPEQQRKEEAGAKKGGLIVLPLPQKTDGDRPRCPEMQRKTVVTTTTSSGQGRRSLFDPNNPNKPIIVKSSGWRVAVPGFSENVEVAPPQLYTTDQNGNPAWYKERSESYDTCHYPDLLKDVIEADRKLQEIINAGSLFLDWGNVHILRCFLMESLEYLLSKDMKFCQKENVEQHFWKILFHNIIEMTRKAISEDSQHKEQYKGFILWLIDNGTKFFEGLLERLEATYKFKLNDYLGQNMGAQQKGMRYTGMALISAQKIYLFLGDLGRYREQVNETTNYGKCRQWYIKAQEINPKNGKPYHQLAVLAVYARRKLDAVYFYMRSLMSSNPVQSARESLISLFDENRKKYEQGERKRREERLERARLHMKEKESEASAAPGSLRKEIWVHPNSGKRVHRTTSAVHEQKSPDSEEEDLASLSSVDVNKRFVTSYLHVHGKLITKIGMESFQEAALQMLKEFRALLQHSPVPLPCNRFLQLLALNMFAIESTQLRDPSLSLNKGYRSELQERALIVSLQMFNLILERCVSLLQEHVASGATSPSSLPMDAQVLLPAVKIWSDWLLCNSTVWNPPPSTQDYRVGPPGDAWSRLATLMNLLEKLDITATADAFVSQQSEGYDQVRLPEDNVLSGFTPLMFDIQEQKYAPRDVDPEVAQVALRLTRLIFFGTVFLCGLEPPVLKLEYENDFSEYVSVVCASSSPDSPPTPPELEDDDGLMVESFSEDDGESEDREAAEDAPSEIRDLLNRKVELEKRHRIQELHRQRVQKILRQSVVSVHIEVRPKYLVPDTNCFIDYLAMLKRIAEAHFYTLMVPLVVLNELEGLAKGGKTPAPVPRSTVDPEHVLKVADSAKTALDFLAARHPNVKCITTKGTILTSTTFTVEDDSGVDVLLRNDDKILSACLTFCKGGKDEAAQEKGEPRKLFREVVLLTEDRNLRVKALARDVPVRELPDFLQWAGLG